MNRTHSDIHTVRKCQDAESICEKNVSKVDSICRRQHEEMRRVLEEQIAQKERQKLEVKQREDLNQFGPGSHQGNPPQHPRVQVGWSSVEVRFDVIFFKLHY